MSEDKNQGPFSGKLTLPWLIITILSMVTFLAFLIAMFFSFHAAVFFGVFLLVIAAAVLLDGIQKRKESRISGNVNLIMGILCIVCAAIVMNM